LLYPAYMILLWYHACERIYDGESWKYEGRPLRKCVALSAFTLAFPFLWVYWAIPWSVDRLSQPAPERGPRLTPARAALEVGEVRFGMQTVSEQLP
jgi:hypothetical protein